MPQWQGGDVPSTYGLGAKLLAWLAPDSGAPLIEVPVVPDDGKPREEIDGIVSRKSLIKQLDSARNIIDAYAPDRIVIFGGDCLVEQAPISYLNERYCDNLGVLWIDAHPDVTTPKEFNHAHTMVLGNLLGDGDQEFANKVKVKLKPKNIMFAGLQETTQQETEYIKEHKLRRAWPKDLAENSNMVTQWIEENDIKYLAVHLDLDVLDPSLFRSLLFANPTPDSDMITDFSIGEMTFPQLARLLVDVSKVTDVVGLGITEQMPWDALNLRKMFDQVPILNM